MNLSKEELSLVSGGAISATFLNAISRFATTLYDIGYALGRSFRRWISGNAC